MKIGSFLSAQFYIALLCFVSSSFSGPSPSLDLQVIHQKQIFKIGPGGQSTLAISLPMGTTKWYYSFKASKKAEDAAESKAVLSLFGQLATLYDGGVTSIALSSLVSPTGSAKCHVELLAPSGPNGQRMIYTSGSRQNLESGIVEIVEKELCLGTQHLAIRNPAFLSQITAEIEVVAVVSKEWPAELKQLLFEKLITAPDKAFANQNDKRKMVVCVIEKSQASFPASDFSNKAEYEITELFKSKFVECGATENQMKILDE